MGYHVTTEEFEEIVQATLDRVEASLRARMDGDNLMITVQQASSDDDRENGIDEHVLGFYQGASGSTFSAYELPKRIVLLQGNIERWSSNRTELVSQISDTVLHEVAHYFGMNHHDIEQTRLRH